MTRMRDFWLLLLAPLLLVCGCAKQPVLMSAAPPPAPPPVVESSLPAPQARPPAAPPLAPMAMEHPPASVPAMPSFPWPPPEASTQLVLPSNVLTSGQQNPTLGNVDDRITMALSSAGYAERSYLAVPDGFAIATKLEQISDDGTPKQPPARWVTTPGAGPSIFSLSDYLHALFTADPGYYRVIVFAITDVPFAATGTRPTEDQSNGWLRSGFNTLPASLKQKPFEDSYSCTALVYEFERTASTSPQLTSNGPDAATHLRKAGIWSRLGGGQ